MEDSFSTTLSGGNRSRRGMSSATALVVLVITIVVLGAISFVVFNTSVHTCQPANSPVCMHVSSTHDVSILAPFTSAQQDQLIPFTALLTSGETATQFKFNFGDGSAVATSATPTVDHAYRDQGTYLVYVQAVVGGVIHDNLNSIQVVTVSGSHAKDTLGTEPGIAGRIDANSTVTGSSTILPSGVLAVGQSITVTGRYTSNASNPAYGLIKPSLITSGGSLGTPTTAQLGGFASLTATATFAMAGIYTVTFVGGTQLNATSPINFQNYSWTAYVSSPSGAWIPPKVVTDPHPGTVVVYDYAPGGAGGEDPQVDYETAGFEVILNVYESLITYNGTDSLDTPNGFIPVIATCVPGSSLCGTQFPTEPQTDPAAPESNLVAGYNYTFVIGASQKFYDPANGASWGVWPSDVLFSYARTLAIASDGEATPSWILGQALLPFGNSGWDNGMHAPYNSTAAQIFQHILVNDSSYCPSAALAAPYHGCVTFVANGSGTTPGAKNWPFFLQLLSGVGSGVVPAGWFSAQGSTLPGWTDATRSGPYSGDHPVAAPSASQVAAIIAAQTSASGWDQVTKLLPTNAWGNVQYNMVGSGPYYLAGYTIGTSYTLKANPAYAPNPACTITYVAGTNDCYPPAGSFASKIDVTWEVDPTPGEAAMASGVADFLGEFPTTQTSLLLQLVEQQKANGVFFPGISVYFFPYDLDFSAIAASAYPTGPITAPDNFFSYIGMRNFFSTAFPYSTSQATIDTVDGIQYGFNYGGIIPQGMGNYYPTNISFPSADPTNNVNDPSSPAYWWTQMTTPSSIYYDPEAVACETTTCQLPFFGETGSPNYDQALALEVQSVNQYSHGAIEVHTLDINFIQLVVNSLFSAPGTNPMPIFTLAWAPDYPDPTDYVGAMYYPNATYTYSDAYNVFTSSTATNSSTCPYDSIGTYSFAALQYWAAASTAIANDCQAPAYDAMTFAEYQAAGDLDLGQRALLYNMAEHIAQKLALYIYFYQAIEPVVVAPWITQSSINQQVTIGAGNDQLWFFVEGNGLVPS